MWSLALAWGACGLALRGSSETLAAPANSTAPAANGTALAANGTAPAHAPNGTNTTAPANVSNVTPNATNVVQPLLVDDAAAETATPEEGCAQTRLLNLEAAWVHECFGWDATDPNLHAELRPHVNFARSELTVAGAAEVCVKSVPCIEAVHAYYQGFISEGCAEAAENAPTSAQRAHYHLARNLEEAASNCLHVGPAAALGFTRPRVVLPGQSADSMTGCYHEYPTCLPNCLLLPSKPTLPGSQLIGEVYEVAGQCYKALTRCQGCLFEPARNVADLEPWQCPSVKCVEPQRYNPIDAGTTLTGGETACTPTCLGFPPCGPDGCGGQCGLCGDSEECVYSACVWRTFEHRFEPMDESTVPDWFEKQRGKEEVMQRSARKSDSIVRALGRDFERSSIGAKLGVAGTSRLR